MGLILNLSHDLRNQAVEQSLAAAPRFSTLREAATAVIAAVHGLPDVMGRSLRQIEVYIGRAAATTPHVSGRWNVRYDKFRRPPSAVALVVFRAPTYCVRNEKWEQVSQRIIQSLTKSRALCCANALMGQSGRWPSTDECAIYIVARARQGPQGYQLQQSALDAATVDLIHKRDIDDEVVLAAAREIGHPDKCTKHKLYEDELDEDEEDDVHELKDDGTDCRRCRSADCTHQPYPRNYGFCRKHRTLLLPGQVRCKKCDRAAKPGNYGHCGRHR